MKRFGLAIATMALLAAVAPASAGAAFGFNNLDVTITDSGGSPDMQAGIHPFAMTTSFGINSVEEGGKVHVDGAVKDLEFETPPGFTGNPTATPRCSTVDFLNAKASLPNCADSSAVGLVTATLGENGGVIHSEEIPVYNLEPPPGVAAKIGFWLTTVPLTVDIGVSPTPPYNVIASVKNTPQTLEVLGSSLTLWGNPAAKEHDLKRGKCALKGGTCPAGIPVKPFLTLPRSCTGPLLTSVRATSWWTGDPLFPGPGTSFAASTTTHDGSKPPQPLGLNDCGSLGFSLGISSQPTSDNAESPTGLDFNLDIDDPGLTNPDGRAHSDIQKAVVTLPKGVTLNPSIAEGLATCSPSQLEAETVKSEPGDGCPQASKVGTVEVETPILEDKILKGQLFVATQDDPATTTPGAENPFDTLAALYMVIKDPELGVIVKLAGKVEPDAKTGQLTTTFDDIPQVPVSHFRFHFREGGRSPLITPPGCGTYTTVAQFTPWANPTNIFTTTSDFQISQGVGGGSCPPAGTPPFVPGFSAGTLNNDAGSYSPFNMRLTRRDGDQDLTRFAATLPPGMVAKLAGTEECSAAAIASAKGKTGRSELASPSCPANSQIGNVLAGAGVGSQLTYVKGKIYLAGPYNGAPLSVVSMVPAVAGPFDVGTVVVQVALRVDPRTAEVKVDGAASDPLPHILAGIPLKVRDIRVYVDRPEFTLNPTNCEPFQVGATLWGGGSDVFSSADDAPVSLADRFQAANCANLGFKPSLSLALKGGTKRGDHPKMHSVYKPRPHDANVSDLVLRLPHSAFLDQAHIRTICTRVQFAAKACPKAAIYGKAKVFTPILDEPLTGPVYLRSSNHNLPDFVADLHGFIDFELVGRIDSSHGGIRATFTDLPDAPVSKAIVDLPGGNKGLIINSRGLCARTSRALVELNAQNGRQLNLHPPLKATSCSKKHSRKHARR